MVIGEVGTTFIYYPPYPAACETVIVEVPVILPSNALVAVTVKVVFTSVVGTVSNPVSLMVEVTVEAPVTVQITSFGAKPSTATSAVNCNVEPVFTVALLGVTVTLVTVDFPVVNRIALLNGLTENVFHTW